MMLMTAVGCLLPREHARKTYRARHALTALTLIGTISACDSAPSNTTGPQVPGSLSVSTETSGFLKDDSFDLLLDGEVVGTIGANDEVTISELEPATYSLNLGDLADNCAVEATVAAQVTSANTATASLSVTCAPGEPTPYTIRASRDRPNLDDGSMIECSFGICPSDEVWDIYAQFNTSGETRAVIHQNQKNSLEIAHVTGVSLSTLTEADYDGASFTTEVVTDPFDTGRVILVRTDQGAVFALGNPVEDKILLTLTYDAALLVAAP